jgi:hypothetical protein
MGARRWIRTPRATSQAFLQACPSAFSSAYIAPRRHLCPWILPRAYLRVVAHLNSHSSTVFTRTSSKRHACISSTMPGYHSTSPSCRVKCWLQSNGRFYGPVTSGVHDTTNLKNGPCTWKLPHPWFQTIFRIKFHKFCKNAHLQTRTFFSYPQNCTMKSKEVKKISASGTFLENFLPYVIILKELKF